MAADCRGSLVNAVDLSRGTSEGTLLVVDDSRASARLIGTTLAARGYEILLAHSGEEALAVLAREHVDCVLLDMIMPGLSGEETCRRIRKIGALQGLPVIIVTGREGDFTSEGIDAGADDYVVKSSDLRPLAARVRAQLRRRALEKESARMREAEHDSRFKSAFLAMMSHELRTPLNAVLGFTALLRDETLSATQKSYVDLVHDSAGDLRGLVDRILDFTSLDTATLDRQSLTPDAVLECLRPAVEALAAPRRMRVEYDIGPTPPVFADARRLQEILVSIVSNAIKFGRDGLVSVRIRSNNASVEFVVEDRGVGIAAEEILRILSGFDQVGTSVLRKAPGIGLGLLMSKRLVEMHGGSLGIASEKGVGTTVTVTIPAAQNEVRPGTGAPSRNSNG